ncbi:MAG: NADPH-dependent reductase [Planctomycetaceae bacterium]|nr:NADPH-dependent reductase [Planctomycetaceae bacterium]
MTQPKILAFSGSLRAGSYNTRLVRIAAEGARKAGAEVTVIELRDYPLPVFDEDLEIQGTPENALKLKELMLSHHGLLISSPEYNSSLSAALKNALDWISRPIPNKPRLACYQNKVAGIVSASIGALGGLRGLVHLRAILGNINVLVIPDQVSVPNASEAFTSDGQLVDAGKQAAVAAVGEKLVLTLRKLLAD